MPRPASPQFLATLGRTIEDGASLHRQGKLAEAERIYVRILKSVPDQFETLQLLAELRMARGRPGEAFRLMSAAVAARPSSADAHVQLGHALRALKRDADALASYEKAAALDPQNLDAIANCVETLCALGRPAEALDRVDRILAGSPGRIEWRAYRGAALAALGRQDEALADFDAVLAAAPNPVVSYNRGLVLAGLGREEEAVAAFDRTLAAIPDHAAAWSSRGVSLHALNRHADAIASFDRAIAIAPDFASAHLNKSLALLAIGAYPHGLPEYEWRWRRSRGETPRVDQGRPMWLGKTPLQNKTILLRAEQGFGETIQFARYVPLLAARGATVVLEVQPALGPLLSRLDGVARLVERGTPLPAFDCHCPLASLPLAFATELATIPAAAAYLSVDPARIAAWRARLPSGSRPTIGINWCGNPKFKGDRNRSMTFRQFAPIVAGLDIASVVLNPGLSADDSAALTEHANIVNVAGEFRDFADTAAAIMNLDLVVTTDTAIAHLAGALGRPVWLLLSFSPDWRWLVGREDCPWYASARLFRQTALGDWPPVIARVRQELETFAAVPAGAH